MVFGYGNTDVEHLDPHTSTTGKTGKSVTSLQFHVQRRLGVIPDTEPEVVGRDIINTDHQMLHKRLEKIISCILPIVIVYILNLSISSDTVQSDDETDRAHGSICLADPQLD